MQFIRFASVCGCLPQMTTLFGGGMSELPQTEAVLVQRARLRFTRSGSGETKKKEHLHNVGA